jgi:hypothetical protein
MTNLHRQDIGFFVDGLSVEQRTFLQRLLGESLSAVAPPGQQPLITGPEAEALAQAGVEPLFHLLEALRCFAASDSSDIRPFSVSMPKPGHAVVVVTPRILSWRGIWEAQSHQWVVELHVGQLTVNVTQIREPGSSTIAWLVNLASHMPNRRIELIGASESLRRAIGVLRLETTLSLDPIQP